MLTIPPEVLITSARPDMVYINNKKLVLIELTIPSNTIKNLEDAHQRKYTKQSYQLLLSDLETACFNVDLVTVEVGSLGHSLPSSHNSLVKVLPNILTKHDAWS